MKTFFFGTKMKKFTKHFYIKVVYLIWDYRNNVISVISENELIRCICP